MGSRRTAEDSEGLLRWEAVGLEKGRGRSIYRYTGNKTSAIGLHYRCEKTSKKNIAELWRMIWRSPGFLRTSGKPMTVNDMEVPGLFKDLRKADDSDAA